MAATGDRVPTVYVENRRVAGLDSADPIRVSYTEPLGDWPTGRGNPDLLTLHPSHGHDQTIVNGVSRIGYMTGGKAALWKDQDMADTFTRQADAPSSSSTGPSRSSCSSRRTIRTSRACRIRGLPARRRWGRAVTPSRSSTGRSARCSPRSIGCSSTRNTIVLFTSDNGPVVDDGYRDDAVEKLGDHTPGRTLPRRQVQQLRGAARGCRSWCAGRRG